MEQSRREEIFEELSSNSPADVTKFAYCLASIPHRELRSKYMRPNAVLFILLLLLAELSFGSKLPIDLQQSTLFIAIKVIVPLIFSYFIYQFHGGVYRILAIWCVIDLIESLLFLKITTGIDLAKLPMRQAG